MVKPGLLMMAGWCATIVACGPKATEKPVTPPPPDAEVVAPPPIDAAVAVVEPEMPPPPTPPAKPLDPDSLPQLTPVAAAPKAPATPVFTIYAADADGDALLRALDPKINYVFSTTRKRVTGKLHAPKGYDAFATVAGLIGADVTPVVAKGKAVPVQFDFLGGPMFDLLRVIADTGKVNIVVAPGKLPDLTVRLDKVPWDQALAVMVQRAGLITQREGNTFFIVPPGTKVAPRNAKIIGPTLDIEANNAMLADLTEGIRFIHPKFEMGTCSRKRVTQTLKRAPLADLVRALEVASGEKFEPSEEECHNKGIEEAELDKLQLVAIISAGTKRVAVFNAPDEAIVVGSSDDKAHFKEIGTGWVEFASGLVRQLRPGAATQGEDDDDDWVASLKRTSALVRRDDDWRGLVEQGDFTMDVDGNTKVPGMDGIRFKVGFDGVHVMRESGSEMRLMPLALKKN